MNSTGGFTMPVEAEYEDLSLELAKRWGADVIRDSSGTKLSQRLLNAGYSVYSMICPIRGHNEWIKQHLHVRQQCFLCTEPKIAKEESLSFTLMEGFYSGQFSINDTSEAMAYWQVYDRTVNAEHKDWRYDSQNGAVVIENAVPWHKYTVSFLAWRIWEEISMYDHTINNWNTEPLMQLDPIYPEAQEYLKKWLANWCKEHPLVSVVRFTSLFYNFAWIWGADKENLFTDWASYDFAVSPYAMKQFKKRYGYRLTSEDFIRKGLRNATHRPPTKQKLDWMEFVSDFVRRFSKELIDIVHAYDKKAYVFYDDSWVGMEPYNGKFQEFGFDGIIKCVFSGFEARLCAGVDVDVHELRFHPYLFPVGLNGAPTFSKGGNPAQDARRYWINVRRALLRERVERTGLGGYPHLVQDFPDFVDTMEEILDEFRMIADIHRAGKPVVKKPRVGILHSWGSLRNWTLSGHFHETDAFTLIHIIEALSGLPLDVRYLSFEDVKTGRHTQMDLIITAGNAGDAWSGGDNWRDENLYAKLTEWVHEGGIFVGVGEPSAVEGYDTFLRMAHVLGVDIDNGERACHGKRSYTLQPLPELNIPSLSQHAGIYLTDDKACVHAEQGGIPTLATHCFGNGLGVYISDFCTGVEANRFLLDLLLYVAGQSNKECVTDTASAECAVFPDAGKILFVNNTFIPCETSCVYGGKRYSAKLKAAGMVCINI